MKPSFPASIWVWLIAIAVSSFLTWGAVGSLALSGFPFGGFSVSVNAWTGYLNLLGIQFPNWLTVVAAFGAVGASYARSSGAQLSPRLPGGLLLYATAHVALFSFFLWGNGNSFGRGALGIGSILMFVSLIGLWRALKQVVPYRAPIVREEETLTSSP